MSPFVFKFILIMIKHKIEKVMQQFWQEGVGTAKNKGDAVKYALYSDVPIEAIVEWVYERFIEMGYKTAQINLKPNFKLRAKKIVIKLHFPFPDICDTVEINIVFDGVIKEYLHVKSTDFLAIKGMILNAIILIKARLT